MSGAFLIFSPFDFFQYDQNSFNKFTNNFSNSFKKVKQTEAQFDTCSLDITLIISYEEKIF